MKQDKKVNVKKNKLKQLLKIGVFATVFMLVPVVANAQYIVKPGDTLFKIAREHKMSLSDIISLNRHLDNPNLIRVGDHIVLRTRDKGQDIVDYAKSLQDKTVYVFGGQETYAPPLRTDCSGFVQHIFGKFGVKLPRTSRDQALVGKAVALKDVKAGDLLFFSTRKDKVITHVGIAIDNDYFISNLNEKKNTEIMLNWSTWSRNYFVKAKRIL